MFLESLKYLVYPNVCLICGKKIAENKTYACEKCNDILKYNMKRQSKFYINKHFEKVISCFEYEGVIRNKILEFKFRNKPYLGNSFAKIMAESLAKIKNEFDLIIPVPMHYKRYFKRGYNQSSILAKQIAKLLNKKCVTHVLRKVKNVVPQSTLNSTLRKTNVLNTYQIFNDSKILGKRILLIDDIYTTGATADECAKILKTHGVKSVIVATIACSNFCKEDKNGRAS